MTAMDNHEVGFDQAQGRETLAEGARHAALAADYVRLFEAEQRARERTVRLQAITSALSNAVTPEQVAQVIVEQAADALGADAGGVGVVTPDQTAIHALHTVGYPAAAREPLEHLPLDAGIPAAVATRTGQLIVLETADDRQRLFPTPWNDRVQYGSVIALPLTAEGRVIGVLGLNYSQYRLFSADDRAFLLALGEQCAQALERARLYRQAEEAIRIREEFMSIASHELKTPLTSLAIVIRLLRRHVEAGTLNAIPHARLKRTLELADGQLEKLDNLVNDLLDTGRISAGRLELRREEVDLVDIAREVVERYADEADAAGSRVELHTTAPVRGDWDRTRLDQVVTNLLSNAIKYGGGKPIEISVTAQGSVARLMVKDSGIGIPADDLPLIFERFERAVSSRHFSGLGLGLYISRQIVEAHGGTIEVASEEGRGSTFTVDIPFAAT